MKCIMNLMSSVDFKYCDGYNILNIINDIIKTIISDFNEVKVHKYQVWNFEKLIILQIIILTHIGFRKYFKEMFINMTFGNNRKWFLNVVIYFFEINST